MNAEEAAIAGLAQERLVQIDSVGGEAGPEPDAAADAEDPVQIDAHAHARVLDDEFAGLSQARSGRQSASGTFEA